MFTETDPSNPGSNKNIPGPAPFRTYDLDIAIERITRMFGPHQIEPAGHGRDIEFEHSHVWLDDICINQLAYGRELRNRISEFVDENYCVMLPVEGSYAIEASKKRVEADAKSITIINPDCPVTLEASSDYRNVSVRISRNAIDNALVNHTGERPAEPVQFVPHPQLLKDGAEPLRNLVMQVWQECRQNMSVSTFSAVGRELEMLLASMLLKCVPNNYSRRLLGTGEISPSAACEVAVHFLKKNAREDIAMDEIIKVSGLAKTSLYTEFHKYYSTTPMVFLRRERLRLAHDTLTSANPDTTTVTRVALECGFTHFSRFAYYYKQQFGELPSETLQRGKHKIQ